MKVAGRRWSTEENFQTAKTLTGLDQHQVRRWRSRHRWTLLAMLAHAFLTVLAIDQRTTEPTPDGLITITRNEIRHLFAVIILTPIRTITHRLHWSTWRRRPPTPRPHQPLPATIETTHMITKSGWSISLGQSR